MKQNIELKGQAACFKWAWNYRKETRPHFFAVINEAYTSDKKILNQRKAAGVRDGVSDSLLLMPLLGFNGLLIEFKAPGGSQSPAQKEWQKAQEAKGYAYKICVVTEDDIQEFKNLLDIYLYGKYPSVWAVTHLCVSLQALKLNRSLFVDLHKKELLRYFKIDLMDSTK